MKKSIFVFMMVSFLLLFGNIFAIQFSDLSKQHWGYNTIIEMTNKGILNGYGDGTFKADNSITRAEFSKIMSLTLNLKNNVKNIKYEDVDINNWSYQYVSIADDFLSGYVVNNKNYFRPNEKAIREDVTVAVIKALNIQNVQYDLKTLERFSDNKGISNDCKKYVAIAIENNLLHGNADGTFNPKGELTRAEVCQLMHNIIENISEIEAIKETSKETETVKDTSKETETVKDTPKETETTKDTPKETETTKDTPKEIETTKEVASEEKNKYINVDSISIVGPDNSTTGSLSVNISKTLQLSASINPSNATNKNVTWSSSNEGVLTISQSGLVTPVKNGKATITAEADGKKTSREVIVKTVVLFVGNSKTYYNNLPYRVKEFSEAGGKNIDVYTVTQSGQSLIGNSTSGQFAEAINRNVIYDFVVLQENNDATASNTKEGALNIVRRLCDSNNKDIRVLYYSVWLTVNETKPSDKNSLKKARASNLRYSGAATATNEITKTNAKILWISNVFIKYRKDYGKSWKKENWLVDERHPTYYGTYLTTCSLYLALFDESPVGVNYLVPKGVSNQINSNKVYTNNSKKAKYIKMTDINGEQINLYIPNSPATENGQKVIMPQSRAATLQKYANDYTYSTLSVLGLI